MHLRVYRYSGYAAVPPGLRWIRGGFVCAPCLANWGGEGCRGLVCCLVIGCFVCGAGEDCRLLACCLVVGVLRVGRGRAVAFQAFAR